MMLRLLTLTDSQVAGPLPAGLAGRILQLFHDRRGAQQNKVLNTALGGWFPLLMVASFLYIALRVTQIPLLIGADIIVPPDALSFLAARGLESPSLTASLFDAGRDFMILMALTMMGFVLRSYASLVLFMRPVQITLCAYAIAGLIFFSNLEQNLFSSVVIVFEYILLQNGAMALIICVVFVLVPLTALALSRPGGRDALITACGFVSGLSLLVCFFIPFTPALTGYAALCGVALFLAWGHADLKRFDKAEIVG